MVFIQITEIVNRKKIIKIVTHCEQIQREINVKLIQSNVVNICLSREQPQQRPTFVSPFTME
jgi:hypothetical protein